MSDVERCKRCGLVMDALHPIGCRDILGGITEAEQEAVHDYLQRLRAQMPGVAFAVGHQDTVEELVAKIERRTTDFDVVALCGKVPAIVAELKQLRAEQERLYSEALGSERIEHNHTEAIIRSIGVCPACDRGRIRYFAAVARERRWAINRALAISPEDAATSSRDYGRGYAQAIRDVRAALDDPEDDDGD